MRSNRIRVGVGSVTAEDQGEGSRMLEKWTLEKRLAFFQQVFGLSLEVLE